MNRRAQLLTLLANVLYNTMLTDMETGFKAGVAAVWTLIKYRFTE